MAGNMVQSLQDASLPDGTVVKVDAKTAWALGLLNQLAVMVATGRMDAMHIVWFNGGEKTNSALYYNRIEPLLPVSQVLQKESKRLPQIASLWEGNMPMASRSFRDQ